MASQSDRLTGMLRRSFEYVLSGPIMLDEVQIGGGEFLHGMTKISYYRDRFQKYFRQNHSRAHIQINAAAIEILCHRTEQSKVAISRIAYSFAGCGGMNVDDVRADGDMDCHRNVFRVSARENAQCVIGKGR